MQRARSHCALSWPHLSHPEADEKEARPLRALELFAATVVTGEVDEPS